MCFDGEIKLRSSYVNIFKKWRALVFKQHCEIKHVYTNE